MAFKAQIAHIFFMTLMVGFASLVIFFATRRTLTEGLRWPSFGFAGALPLVLYLAPNLSTLMILLTLMILTTGIERRLIAPVYIVSIFIVPELSFVPAIGSTPLMQFSSMRAVALGALVATILTKRSRDSVSVNLDIPALLIFSIILIISTRGTSATNFIRLFADLFLTYAAPYIILSRGIRNVRDLKFTILHVCYGALILSFMLLFEAVRGWPLYRALYVHYDLPVAAGEIMKWRRGFLRAAGPQLESTSIALTLVVGLLSAWMAKWLWKSRLHQIAVITIMSLALLAPQSRGAWLAAVVSIAAASAYRNKIGLQIFGIVLAMSAVVGIFVATNIQDVSTEQGQTIEYRKRLWERGIEQIAASPLLGVSTEQAQVAMNDLRQAEHIIDFVNAYIFIGVHSGVVGLLVFVSSFGWILKNLLRARGRLRDSGALDSASIPFGFVIALLVSFGATGFGSRPAVLTFALFGLSAAICAKKMTLSARPPATFRRRPVATATPDPNPAPD